MTRLPLPLGASALLLPASLAAQTLPIPLDNSSIAPQAVPTPASTPSAEATPAPTAAVAPTLRPTPTPRATSTPRPSPSLTPNPSPSPRVTPGPAPTTAAPSPSPTPAPLATASPDRPVVVPTPIETVVMPQSATGVRLWPWLLGGAVVLLALAGLLWRRRDRPDETWEDAAPAEEPPVSAASADVPPLADAPTPERPAPSFFSPGAPAAAAPALAGPSTLTVEFRPTRAGLNLLTATVESELVVTNTGDAPASGIRVAVPMFGAHRPDEPDLARIAAASIGRPVVPAFSLAPGEARRFRAVAALPNDAIVPLQAGGRPMFVPIVVAQLRWTDPAGDRAAARAWAVGVERPGADKLAPFWLDVAPRSYDDVAAREHGVVGETH